VVGSGNEDSGVSEAGLPASQDRRVAVEFNMSIPSDARFTETVRELAVHAAKQSGCSEARAVAFGQEVEDVVRGHIEDGAADASVPLVFRCSADPVEVLVNGRTLTP
jgi:hypothetical protein